MKRTLLLPLLTISALVSQGWAQWTDCTDGSGSKLYCYYAAYEEEPESCWNISMGEDDSKLCVDEIAKCKDDFGTLYKGNLAEAPGAEASCAGAGLTLVDGSGGGGEPSDNGYKIFAYIKNSTESMSAWGTDAFVYAYNGAEYTNPENPYYPSDLAVDEGVLKLKGVSNLTTGSPGAFLAIKAITDAGTLSTGENGEKITDCTEGFSYWYKGNAHWFLLEFDPSVCGSSESDGSNKWGIKVTIASNNDWTYKVVSLNDFSITNTWGSAECTSANNTVQLNKVEQMVWGFDDKQTGTNLMIGDIVCLTSSGDEYADTKPDNSITVNTGYFAPPASSSSGSGDGSSSSGNGGSSSSSGGGTSSSSDDGLDPIISYSNVPITGLNVVSFANSLQIASGKDAAVSLFNLRGEQVLSQKVLSGTTTISLKSQKQGFYYAVVKAGSQKKVVKVVLK
jgi:hypothetical protein